MGLTIEGSAMAAGIGGCLLLSGLFFYLAARARRRSARWRGAVRLPAVVTSLEYQEARRGQREINDHRSSTQVTLCFVDQGRRYQRQRQYPGIVLTPQLGQKVPILFQRDSGDWILRSEARTRWPLFLALGGGFLAAGLALLLDGPGILASLAAYHVDTPNLAGCLVCALIGLLCGASAYAALRGVMPDLLRSAAEPFLWAVRQFLLHRYEEVDALCVGIIRREAGDDDVCYYPFFRYCAGGRQLHWFPRQQMSPKRYQPGARYTLYRDLKTGRCSLKPGIRDLFSALFTLVPMGFFTILILSLAVCAAGTLLLAGMGLASLLAA